MTQQTKLLKLRGSIHDAQYLFAGIRAILLLKDPSEKGEVIAGVRKEISDYNREFAEKYNLGKPRSIGPSLANDVVTILKALDIVELEKKKIRFSPLGEHLAFLLENSQTKGFRNEMTKLMVNKFSQLSSFLTSLYRLTINGELVLPKVTPKLLEISKGDTMTMADRMIEVASRNLTETHKSRLSSLDLQKKLRLHIEMTKGKKIKSLEVAAHRYLISNLMGPEIANKRTYDIIRDQCVSLFLVNSGYLEKEDTHCEVVYLTSWLYPDMMPPSNINEFNDIDLGDGRQIRIHEPSSPGFKVKFSETVSETFRNLQPEFGFVKISDLRNEVCKKLRISDRFFDSEIVTLHQQNPQKFSLSYSFEKVTSKKLPILVGDTLKTIYNLIRIAE